MRRSLLLTFVSAAALLAACGGGGGSKSPTAPPTVAAPQTVTVSVEDDQFVPKEVQINPGDTVKWVLMGSSTVGHTVTANDGSFDSGKVFTASGASFQHTFTTTGVTILYHCQTHYVCCMMQGSVRVGDNAPVPTAGY